MNLEELRTVQSKERQKDSLQNLRPSFYREVGDYIADLEAERERVADAADDPFSSPEVGRLTDEIETAKDVVEAIYERRMGKLVKQASLAAAGMPANDEGLTAEEADLFDDLIDRIQGNKRRVLDVLEGAESAPGPDAQAAGDTTAADANGSTDGPTADSATDERPSPNEQARSTTADDAPPAPPESPAADGVSAADVMGGDPPSSDPPGVETAPTDGSEDARSTNSTSTPSAPSSGSGTDPRPSDADPTAADDSSAQGAESRGDTGGGAGAAPDREVDRVTVRITRDVGSILGVDDREYTLSADDVVTLPERNADPLVERDAAEPLE
ncbi:hypothetical protein ACFQGT_14895 [Natrialbaceae archaeon GCM10025810]|uniref:DNA replication complex subunit Gins51 n=1 Tax=Halovalidus salilacus TaxID=3075124 RepID=UPI00361E9F9F